MPPQPDVGAFARATCCSPLKQGDLCRSWNGVESFWHVCARGWGVRGVTGVWLIVCAQDESSSRYNWAGTARAFVATRSYSTSEARRVGCTFRLYHTIQPTNRQVASCSLP